MESSSENSFTWTDTSDDSIDSNVVTADKNATDSACPNSERDDREQGKKKKSKDRGCNGIKEGCDMELQIKMEKEQLNNESKNGSPKKKMVKLEPESDGDIPRKKKKRNHIEVKGNQKDLQDSASYDESFLDLKVKQEDITAKSVSNKKIKKQKPSNLDDSDITEIFKGNCYDEYEQTVSENILNGTTGSSKSKKKKKKSNKRGDSEGLDEIAIDSKINIVEINNEQQVNKSAINSSLNGTNETFHNESGCEELSAIQCDGDDNLHTISFNDDYATEKGSKNKDKLYRSTIISQFKMANNNVDGDIQISHDKRTPHISDRITFEDSDDPATELTHAHSLIEDRISSKLKKFIKANINMKLVSQKLQNSSILTHDDEIWIVKCPKEIDIQSFCDTDLNLHGKCKIKVGGQTYDGSLDEEQCDITTALTMEHDKFKVENLPLCGIVNFRKRIPKAHFRDDNIMVNNQTNFIPLPETKCRHPLFGSNYKKALKIPAAVLERLNAKDYVEEVIPIEKKKKKKHKKEKILEYEESESNTKYVIKSEANLEMEVTEKKKKKRKHSYDEGPAPKRVRKIKHDPESAEAWESEKAIEQNLFDF